jgi:hypothetical protein
MKWFKFKKKVDERQEIELLRAERDAFVVMSVVLVIVMMIKISLAGFDINEYKNLISDYIVLFAGIIGLTVSCIKRGVWVHTNKPNKQVYFICSFLGSILFSIIFFFVFHFMPMSYRLYASVIAFFVGIIIAFTALLLIGKLANKSQMKLQEKYSDDE